MNRWNRWFALTVLAVVTVGWLSGCTAKPTGTGGGKTDKGKETGPKDTGHGKEHGKNGHKDGDHGKPLTEKDVKMPGSFKEGVDRLEELQKKIHHQIEDNELKHVHRTAEEMRLVALKTKELAQKEVPEDKLADVGKACNEIAASFEPIDKAADDGKKAEVDAIHKKVGDAIARLKAMMR